MFAAPFYKFDKPPYPLDYRFSNLCSDASAPEAIIMHEYFTDERNWPNWVHDWLAQHGSEPDAALVRDHRLIVNMLVLQDSWKRMHDFPVGQPVNINCSGVCTAECNRARMGNGFTTWPALWGWPGWKEVQPWEIKEFELEKKKLRTPLEEKVHESQEYRESRVKINAWLTQRASEESSFKIEYAIPGCKFRGGVYWATMDDIRRDHAATGREVKYSMAHG